MSWPGSFSRAGSYSTLPERISRSSSSTARRAWSLVWVRSFSLTYTFWNPTRTTVTIVRTIVRTVIEIISSRSVMPSSDRSRSLRTGGRLVVGLRRDRAEVDREIEGAQARAGGADGVRDVAHDRRQRLGDGLGPGARGRASGGVGEDRPPGGQGGDDVHGGLSDRKSTRLNSSHLV